MEEKIKIYIPESVNAVLLKDMERFEFFKKDGSFNKNEFYNTLILNYYQQYQEKQSERYDSIRKAISEQFSGSEMAIGDVASRILQHFDDQSSFDAKKKSEMTLSLKPTRKTADVFRFIESYALHGSSLSSYFRNLFSSYVLFPQDKRERIIFKNNFERIEKAISEDRKICFSTINSDVLRIVSPYSICNSKEELFNYLLAQCDDLPYSFRVGRIRTISLLNEKREFKDGNIAVFQKMEDQGPQYSYQSKELNTIIKVYLTDRGKRMFKSIYLHRPFCIREEDGFYYFECSQQQAYQYFCRFGKNAIVIEPESLQNNLYSFYGSGAKAYKEYKKSGILKNSSR